MESENTNMVSSGGNGGNSNQTNSRWNPTKEQITMLENIYRQGVRTPSAEQIQQITSRLKAFGHIEGKNVFYWFQNHKARQRQKQKEENIAYFNRYLQKAHYHHHHQPFFPPPCPNAICGSYYLPVPQSDSRFYPHYPKVLLPNSLKRRARSDQKINEKAMRRNAVFSQEFDTDSGKNIQGRIVHSQETLSLFPLHPTGILQAIETTVCSLGSTNNAGEDSVNAVTSTTTPPSSCSSDETTTSTGVEDCLTDKSFFDFLSNQE